MSYWNTYLQKRISRRRALVVAGAGIGASAFLAACGGDEEDSGGSTGSGSTGSVSTGGSSTGGGASAGGAGSTGGGSSGASSALLTEPENTTAKAKRGGTWPFFANSDTPGFDQLSQAASTVQNHGNYAYSRLLKYATGEPGSPATGDVVGDAAASWELSPDRLTLTFKLRSGMKFDPRPPTNGKVLTSEDVKFSWDKYVALSGNAPNLAVDANPSAPIKSLSTPDAETVVMDLAYPMAPILPLLAFHWYLTIQPTEAEGGFDPKTEMRGSGPWMLESYTPSVKFGWLRNPNYYEEGRPYFDGLDQPILTEYTQGLAQFEAGNLWTYQVSQEDVIRVKKDHMQINLFQNPQFARNNPRSIVFGWREDSPWKDERMRQAASMAIDRKGMVELEYSPSAFESEGIPVEARWHSHISAGEEGWWVDPQSSEMGDGSKYFDWNPDEAKKLAAAAGYGGSEIIWTYFPTNRYDVFWPRQGEAIAQMLNDAGFNVKINTVDYDTEYNPSYLNGKADFDGIAYLPAKAEPDVDGHFGAKYTVGGRATYIAEPIPGISEMIVAQRREFDRDQRIQIVQDIQKGMAVYMPAVPVQGIIREFEVAWPWLSNFGGILQWASAAASELYPLYWFDESKKTS